MRMLIVLMSCMCLFGIIALAAAADLPNPWAPCEEACIGPVPVPVMEQMFWVQLPLSPDNEIAVVAPEGITLLDKTRPGQREFTRLYFRADRGFKDAQIVLTPAGGDKITVPLTVKTYREDLDEQLKRVPELVPSARKQGRSYYTDEVVAVARENLEKYPDLVKGIAAESFFDRLSDEELWKAFPSWSVPRDCYSNWPCPKCGTEIFKKSGFYPWGRSYAYPWRCKCPVCGELYPTNDYANDDFTSGDYPDDGWGYDPGTGHEDAHAWVANYAHHNVWQNGQKIRQLALRYLLLGDEEAAHGAGILLGRLAYVYPGLNYRWQQARPTYLGRTGRALVDGNWERNNLCVPALQAYDAIFDYIEKDTKLVEFLHAKDPTINSPDDVKALLDTCLVQVFGWDWIRRELTGGSQGSREQDMAEYVLCANMGAVSDRWLEELFTHAHNSGLEKGGFDDAMYVNALTREGPTLVSGLGYAIGYMNSKSDMAEVLSRVHSEKYKARTNLYDEKLYPKLRAEYDTWIDLLVAGQFGPSYGDSGGGRGARFAQGLPASHITQYCRAYRHWPTDRIARAIYRGGFKAPTLFEPDIWPQVEAQVNEVGPEPPFESRVIDGAGWALLESRSHATDLNQRAGVAMRYGYGHGHHHSDNLNIEMFAHGEDVTPELGYPCWAHPLGATGSTVHHNTGMIDRDVQYSGAIGKGTLELFAGAREASFADVSAAPSGFPNRVYRRAVCLADAPGNNVYLFDVLRMAGGTQRTYCFHGPPHDGFSTNLQFGAKSSEPWPMKSMGRRLNNNILEPQTAQSDADVWADWQFEGRDDLRMRLDLLAQPDRTYYTARYGKTDVPPHRFLFAEDELPDGASEFIALWQPYLTQPFIETAERLPVQGDVAGEFEPVAVRVTLAGGQVDTFIYTSDPDAELKCGDIEFTGSFGYISEQDGRLRVMHLVNGRRLVKAGQGITEAVPRFAGELVAVNLPERTATITGTLPAGDVLEGSLIYLRNGPHRTAYHIVNVSAEGNVVKLDHDALIYRSAIETFGEGTEPIVCELPPVLPPSGGAEPYGYYDGALVTGEDFKAGYRVVKTERTATRSGNIYLDRPADEKDFPDVNGDGRRMLYIYDFGPGEQITVYNSVFADFTTGQVTGPADAKIAGL
jgi:hypothetical protein